MAHTRGNGSFEGSIAGCLTGETSSAVSHSEGPTQRRAAALDATVRRGTPGPAGPRHKERPMKRPTSIQ